MKGKSYLNNIDKAIATITLWIIALSVVAAAVTLPMLPERVMIFYKTVDMPESSFSKYNNLLTVLFSVIPAAILLVAVSLKKRNRLHNNFMSTVIFCIMLSGCMGGVTIYGIMQQCIASGIKQGVDNNTLIALTVAFVLSMTYALLPALFASRSFIARTTSRKMLTVYVCDAFDRLWNVGAYGFIVAGIASAFIPGLLTYIPLAVFAVFHIVFIFVVGYLKMKHVAETKIYDLLED